MTSFRELDLYSLEELLSPEELAVRDRSRRFVDQKVLPQVAGHFEAATFPRELEPAIVYEDEGEPDA